jgi:hypothetical protein
MGKNDGKRKEFEDYFQSILEEIEKEFEKSNNYSKKIDAELEKFEGTMPSKGTQFFMSEHIKNAIALQSQRQSLIKDKFAIKKAVLDYTMKMEEDESAGKTLFEELSKIVSFDKAKLAEIGKKLEVNQQGNIDDKIDELLSNPEGDEK